MTVCLTEWLSDWVTEWLSEWLSDSPPLSRQAHSLRRGKNKKNQRIISSKSQCLKFQQFISHENEFEIDHIMGKQLNKESQRDGDYGDSEVMSELTFTFHVPEAGDLGQGN